MTQCDDSLIRRHTSFFRFAVINEIWQGWEATATLAEQIPAEDIISKKERFIYYHYLY
jgi:hypothetical protein